MNLFSKFYWSELWYNQFSTRFNPRNKWLTKVIPRRHKDKDCLIELVLFTCLKNYVEVEIGKQELFDKNRWKNSEYVPAHQLKFEKELKYTYNLLTKKLPKLEKELNVGWDSISSKIKNEFVNKSVSKDDYQNKYGKIDIAESKVEKLKDLICEWVTKNRKSMWT